MYVFLYHYLWGSFQQHNGGPDVNGNNNGHKYKHNPHYPYHSCRKGRKKQRSISILPFSSFFIILQLASLDGFSDSLSHQKLCTCMHCMTVKENAQIFWVWLTINMILRILYIRVVLVLQDNRGGCGSKNHG